MGESNAKYKKVNKADLSRHAMYRLYYAIRAMAQLARSFPMMVIHLSTPIYDVHLLDFYGHYK